MTRVHERMENQVGMQTLQERNDELRRVRVARDENQKRNADDEAHNDLEIDFLFGGQAKISLLRNFCIVVNESDNGEADQREKRKKDERVRQVCPEQRRHRGGQY